VSDPLVSIFAKDANFLVERVFVQSQVLQKVPLESIRICDDSFPRVVPISFAEELAPVEHAHIKEITVYGIPETAGRGIAQNSR